MKSVRSKMLHEVAGLPVCSWPIEAVMPLTSAELISVVGFQADEVQNAIRERFGAKTSFVVQKEQRGTGDAVRTGLAAVSEKASTIMVIYGDTPLLTSQTLQALANLRASAKVAFCVAIPENPFGYGRIIRDAQGRVESIVEERDASQNQRALREINAGVYAFDAQFLREQILGLRDQNIKNEIYLTDLIATARALHGPDAVTTLEISSDEMLGINDRVQLAQAETLMRHRLNENWMRQGVTIIDPATTYIGAQVELASDVTLYPGVMLLGKTKIANGATIYAHTVIEDSSVGEDAKVGPFARLRPGTVLDENTRIGNFVETKKTHLKKGSKANHLAYLGDAEIGASVNIGAGTITCNYDGFKKYPTHIEDGVFVGSNSTLVAPLTIGKNAYVAAGSTVTKDVPEGDLAISRGRQENKKGYAEKLRSRQRK